MEDMVTALARSGAWQNLPAPVQTALFLGALVFLPALFVCLTGFTRIIIVLSFVRRAVTSQDIPPNQVLLGLSLFLTLFVMGPTLDDLHSKSVKPYVDGNKTVEVAFRDGVDVFRGFMIKQTRKRDLELFLRISRAEPPATVEETPIRVLIPAFIISELKTAFTMGFCIYLPFLLVDLVISGVLTAMGMVMMPPVVISAPFKVLLFVVADGWHLIARALSSSFA